MTFVDGFDGAVEGGVDDGAEGFVGEGSEGLAGADGVAGFDQRLVRLAGTLAEGEDEAAGADLGRFPGGGLVVIEDVEAAGEGLDGDAPALAHGVDLDVGGAGPLEAGLAEGGFGLVAGFFGEEFLGAGEEGAEAAGAAEGGPLVPMVLPGGGEGQTAHDLVGFDGVAEEETGAILGAVAALVAGGLADAVLGRGGLEFALDDVVFAGQDDDTGRSLGDGLVEVLGGLAHHEAADDEDGVIAGEAAGGFDGVAEGGADGDGEGDGVADGAGEGDGFMGDGVAVGGGGDVNEGFNVIDDGANVEGDAPGGDESPGGAVDEVVFVAGRVVVAKEFEADGGAVDGLTDGFDGVFLLGLDPDDAGLGADGVHGQEHAADHGGGLMFHDGGVFVEEGFAFGAVSDDGIGAGGEFDVGREAAAAGAHDPSLPHLVHEAHGPRMSAKRAGWRAESAISGQRPAGEIGVRGSQFAVHGSEVGVRG